MNRLVYYDNDTDGFAAAWAAWKKFGPAATYAPIDRRAGTMPADFEGADEIYLLDFTPPFEVLIELYEAAERLVLFDHHATSLVPLIDVIDVDAAHHGIETAGGGFSPPDYRWWTETLRIRVAKGQSACGLTWTELHGADSWLPHLITYVEDRDLWRFDLPKSREINAAIRSYPRTFKAWDELHKRLSGSLASVADSSLAREGTHIWRHIQRMVERTAREAEKQVVAGETVPVCEATLYISEVGHRLMKDFPECPFCVIYEVTPSGDVVVHLRSRDDGCDVGRLAKAWGGGGHDTAAGFRIDAPPSMVVIGSEELQNISVEERRALGRALHCGGPVFLADDVDVQIVPGTLPEPLQWIRESPLVDVPDPETEQTDGSD